MSVIVTNISKQFGRQKALDQISFTLNKGEITGFIGPNGAGKSTTMRIITGLINADTGSVSVNGKNVSDHHIETMRCIGYLPEQNPLYLSMYVREYLRFVSAIYKIPDRERRIKEIIELTGLTSEQHKKIGHLSKGYRQRTGLAQALLHNPEVLILDEPTSGLDPNQIIEIRNLIKNAGTNKTVFLSTHIMQEVEAICDRIIIINKGHIVGDGKKENICNLLQASVVTLKVEFNGEVHPDELLAIKGVTGVTGGANNEWIIEYSDEQDIRNDVFNFAVSKKLAVLSMQKGGKKLEEVFRELTR